MRPGNATLDDRYGATQGFVLLSATRALVERRSIRRLLAGLDGSRYPMAVAIARLPERIRGFGRVRLASLTRVRSEEDRFWPSFDGVRPAGAPHDDPGHWSSAP